MKYYIEATYPVKFWANKGKEWFYVAVFTDGKAYWVEGLLKPVKENLVPLKRVVDLSVKKTRKKK